jgi:hypothetical protein
MKNLWKWILGFVAVFVAAFFVAMPFFMRGVSGFGMMRGVARGGHMVGGFGGGFFVFGRMFFPLLVLAALGFGIYYLVKRSNRSTPAPVAAVATEPIAAVPVVENTADAAETVETPVLKTCAHCGGQLQYNWVSCPFCGEKI